MSWIPQQANVASCSGIRNCKWIPQNVSGIRKCKWNPQTVSGFQILFITELAYEQLKDRAEIPLFSNAEFKSKDLTIVSGIHEQVSRHWLTKSVDVIYYYLGYISQQTLFEIIVLETLNQINSLIGGIGLRVFRNTTHSISPIYVSI